jgi:hypothetical protein
MKGRTTPESPGSATMLRRVSPIAVAASGEVAFTRTPVFDVDCEHRLNKAGRDVLITREEVKPGIVDEHVDPAERVDAVIDERVGAALGRDVGRVVIDCTVRAAVSASTSLTITAAPASAAAIATQRGARVRRR